MTLAITSLAGATGPVSGGTKCTITGTGLDAVDSVLVGTFQARIDPDSTNTATSLTFIAPAVGNDNAGTKKVTVVDSDAPAAAVSSGNFTYTAVTIPPLVPTKASKWICKVSADLAETDPLNFTQVRGMTNFQPQITPTMQDDSDYDDPEWGSDFVTQLKFSNVLKVDRKVAAGYEEDPGQQIIREAHDQLGLDSVINCIWYVRDGGPEAFRGLVNVQWSEDGGGTSDKSTVSVTLGGRGARTHITNPAA